MKSTTDTVLLISPDHFGFNDETAASNTFQQGEDEDPARIRASAMSEFRGAVETLRAHDIDVLTLPSRSDAHTPDAIFPNNWVSTDELGHVYLYPMCTPNRRAERQTDELVDLMRQQGRTINAIMDLTMHEKNERYLEGTAVLSWTVNIV